MVPAAETTAVAAAPVLTIWETNVTLFWKSRSLSLSFLLSNWGLKLSTQIVVDPIPTDLII